MMFAGSHVVSKKGTQTTSVIAGLIISLATGTLILGVATLTRLPTSLSGKGVAVIAASGILAPALARGAAIAGIDRLGPSTSVPIQCGTYPLLAVLGAIVILHEPVSGLRFAGVVAIVVGVWLLSRPAEEPKRDSTRRLFRRPGVMFPIAAGLAKGSADIVRKTGLDLVPHATFGAALGLATALTVWLVATALLPPVRSKISFGSGTPWFVLGGSFAGLAVLLQFHALQNGDVSTVSPIVASQPIIVLLFSAVFLRGLERVNLRIALGVAGVVVGTILVSL